MNDTSTSPIVHEDGTETHPAFGVAVVTRHHHQPGMSLFQSDLVHNQTITLSIAEAVRRRSGHSDRVFPSNTIVEVSMSAVQWASLVSSVGDGGGTPVTVERVGAHRMPALAADSRLSTARSEASRAVTDLLKSVQTAFEGLEQVESAKGAEGGIKARREALRKMRIAIANASSNSDFAVRVVNEAAESVVGQAKADIDMAVHEAAMRASALVEARTELASGGGTDRMVELGVDTNIDD